ncbi:uncharacterized protein LOC129592990 [Paramacrobiotus metropolitanus]|uniref:uncharacterized protein LOC129592990 n=1 Tax=Paramacrobiotus metropolitanus TaxID=2943436 RepID=UPI0024458233|nr:uncharacterized protein LOC129592990 [Paramacrobiotus metropolitanus]
MWRFLNGRWNSFHYLLFILAILVITLGSVTFFTQNQIIDQSEEYSKENSIEFDKTPADSSMKYDSNFRLQNLLDKYERIKSSVHDTANAATAAVITPVNVEKKDTLEQVLDCPRMTRKRWPWYGTPAYHVIKDEHQAWSWVKTFLAAACEGCRNATEEGLLQRMMLQANQHLASSLSSRKIASLRFAPVNASVIDERITSLVSDPQTQIQRTVIPRSFCTNDTNCLPAPFLPLRTTSDVLSLTGSLDDLHDMTQIITCSSAEFLFTTLYTEPKDDINNDRYATMFYDWLNVMYFEYDWIPLATNEQTCQARFNCSIWIAWRKWKEGERLEFLPPAADGTLPYEVERLSSFFSNPDPGACYRREHFGGTYDHETAQSKIDGRYTLCMDRFPNRSPEDCLVYSFGIRDDWRFDDQMHSLGCSVASFDPSLYQNSSQRAAHHFFYKWGLVTSPEHMSGNTPPAEWTLKTVNQIRRDLNHTHRKLDVLKMDCESPEMTFLDAPDAWEVLANVGQLALELHWLPPGWQVAPKDFDGARVLRNMARIVHRVEKMGFVMFFSRPTPKWVGFDFRAYNRTVTPVSGAEAFVYEVSFLNSNAVGKKSRGGAVLQI